MFRNANKFDYQYPASSVKLVKGKWYVIVSIPAHMRQLFRNQRNLRLSTGTTDLRVAKRMQHDLAQRIYDKFDQRQQQAEQVSLSKTDEYAIRAITDVAKAFKYNRGEIPALDPTTEYAALNKMKLTLDSYVQANEDDLPDRMRKLDAAWKVTDEAKTNGIELSLKVNLLDPPPIEALVPPVETTGNKEWLKKQRDPLAAHDNVFSTKKDFLLQAYNTTIVDSYWQDLLTEAAKIQDLPEPTFDPVSGTVLVDVNGEWFPEETVSFFQKAAAKRGLLPKQEAQPVERSRRIRPRATLTISSVMDEYLSDMRLKQDSLDTQRKLKRWAKKFLDMMGDMEISEIKPTHGFEYINKVLSEYPTRANKTLKDYLWGVQNLLKFCRERGYIDINPFVDLDISKYGKASEQTYPYSREELRTIFAHDWKPQERLLLSILATTGMRPSEAGNMTWERFNDTEHKGIRFLSTLDTDTEQVRVKNQSSKRQVPLHPDLLFPQKGAGRLFDYKKDEDGRCSTDIAHDINPILEQLVSHPNKSLRSFRKTFKIMMRDAGVGEEVHDAITGHRQGDTTGRKNYGGMGLKVKFKAISKLD
ncbi:hypothetical protein N9D61_07925, partial [Planktomarina sp.]|nr:hypothetical protein [Planktomarina sp.]